MELVPASLQLFGPDSPDSVLAFTFDGRCALFRLLPQRGTTCTGTSGSTSAPHPPSSSRTRYQLTEVACLTLPMPHMRDGLLPKRIQGICCSGVAPLARRTPAGRNGGRGVVAAAAHMGLLHVITLNSHHPDAQHGAGGEGEEGDGPLLLCTAVLMSDTPLYGLPPGADPLYVMQYSTHVLAMAFLPPPERGEHEPPLLAVLHKPEGAPGEVSMGLWLDCLALQLDVAAPVRQAPAAPAAASAAGATAAGAASAQAARTAVAAGLLPSSLAPPTGTGTVTSAAGGGGGAVTSAAGGGGGGGGVDSDELQLVAEVCKGPWAVSFEAASRTDLLSVTGEAGGVFCQIALPGLLHEEASLLVADVGGRRLVQVLQGGVRVLAPLSDGGGLAAEWATPKEPLALAAQSAPGGSLLAVASRATLHLLQVHPATGAIDQLHSLPLSHQLSALALARLPSPLAAAGAASSSSSSSDAVAAALAAELSCTALLTGQWLSNTIEVAAAAAPSAPLLRLELGPEETPRSLALLPLPGGQPPVLLAGTHSGRLLMWQTQAPASSNPPGAGAGAGAAAAAAAEGGAWWLGPCHSLRISRVAVELLPGAPGAQQPLEEAVEVVRVHGCEGLRALCHVSTAALPDSACWVTAGGRLLFGRLDPRLRLRWSTAYVGETINSLAYHAASHCLVALCETADAGGGGGGAEAALRVIHADTLQQVLSMRLAPGHYPTSAIVARLPCTSAPFVPAAAKAPVSSGVPAVGGGGSAAPADGVSTGDSTAVAGGKEFVVMASYLMVDSATDPRVAAGGGGGARAGGQLLQGVLSFLELVALPAEDGSQSTSYRLLMHGSVAIPAVAGCLAAARPVPFSLGAEERSAGGPAAAFSGAVAAAVAHAEQRRGGGRQAGGITDASGSFTDGRSGYSSSAGGAGGGRGGGIGGAFDAPDASGGESAYGMPYLVAGCQDGVYMFQVHVDDGAVDGSRAVSGALELVKQLDELRLPLPKHAEALAAAKAAAAASRTAAGGGLDPMSTDAELAEDESELPDVGAPASSRRGGATRDGETAAGPQADTGDGDGDEDGEEGDAEYAYGLGALCDSEDDDEEGGDFAWGGNEGDQAGAGGRPARGAERAPRRAAVLAWRQLRAHAQREHAAAANGHGHGGGGDSSDGDDVAPLPPPPLMTVPLPSSSAAAAANTPLRRLLRDVERDWGTHVTLRQLVRAATFGRCAVTSLAVLDGLVAAGDCLGSVTLLRLTAQPDGRGAAGAAGSGGSGGGSGAGGGGTVALVPASVDRHPIFAQAFLPISPSRLLAAVHPHGLALLARDCGAEERAMREARRQAAAEFEAVAPLSTADREGVVLCFSSSGHVAAVRLTEAPPPKAAATAAPAAVPPLPALAALQAAVAELSPEDAALLTGVDSDNYCQAFSWPLVVPRETASAAGLAGVGSSIAGAGGGGPGDQEADAEEEARLLAAGCVDGALLGCVLRAVQAEEEAAAVAGGAGGGAGGGGGAGRVLRSLAEAVLARPDVGALGALLQRALYVSD
ncbi:hypothetical protein GPECTOR_289g772 [Gonium pectorale]|uniref:Cleavage/polyadenylation specificity factor A subunit N-terminal domain-containing protein n=1 Tax=Gonium pectorale TaxID=33097 RepID=A0A150FXL0_GONPE|nr:hypothetical protein GPECTOR_289g772 [Gonium pectorale]|eukprot:KXZ41770.1 hypothetical protein GPECTOR_289g772 [Gonium pectorale]